MSLEKALDNQRQKLGDRLHWNTVSWSVITLLLDTQGIGYSVVWGEVLSKLSSISRLIDNLLDDEGVSAQELIQEISEESQIKELSLFIATLPEEMKGEFISKWKSAIKTMQISNDNPSITNRELEWESLALLYLSLLDPNTMNKNRWIFFFSLFKASYMFCDLKDIKEDAKSFREAIRIIERLFINAYRLIVSSQNRLKTIVNISLAIARSIKSSSNLSKN